MFDIAPTELLVCAVVALVVIGPKDLPRVMRVVGGWVGRARAMSRHVRAGFDTMMREAEMEELRKEWEAENARIMREFPRVDDPTVPQVPSLGTTPTGRGPAADTSARLADGVEAPPTNAPTLQDTTDSGTDLDASPARPLP